MPESRARVTGLIGVGLLGSALAERIVAAGLELVACDRRSDKPFPAGCSRVETPRDVLAAAGRVVLALPDDEAVEAVLEGDRGLLAGARRGQVVIDVTTGHPARAEGFAKRLGERGATYLDACVSGSSVEARRGEALLLLGGPAGAIASAGDLLEALSPVLYRLGPVGAGRRAKLVVNLLLGLERLALAETFHLAEALGLEATSLLEILRAGPAAARVLDTKGLAMCRGEYPPRARLAQHLKDVRLMLELAEEAGVRLPLSALHRDILERGVEAGLGDLDNAAVREAVRLVGGGGAGRGGDPTGGVSIGDG